MNQSLYLECNSGISGDMMVAALLDIGANQNILESTLKTLPLDGFEIEITRVKKAGLDVCDFNVKLEETHDHDMEYLYGHGHEKQEHEHNHDHVHSHHEEHGCEEEHHHVHPHIHRGMKDITTIIQQSGLSKHAKELAIHIFDILAEAESKAHGVPKDEVHFHEVGAVDSIVDIAAVAICLDNLQISKVIIPVLYEGCGSIRCQHGIIPVPVPAVANIAVSHKLNLHMTDVEGELVTPTGAAIAAAIMTSQKLPAKYTISKIGIGAGKRYYERPSLLRAFLLEESQDAGSFIYKLETNIDDCSGETLGFTQELLFQEGARDVYYTPVYMKKNRPGYLLSVICMKEQIEDLERIIFEQTTTIGIRRIKMERTILQRKITTMETSFGTVQVKICQSGSKERVYPEYESISSICREKGLSYQEVYEQIYQECQKE